MKYLFLLTALSTAGLALGQSQQYTTHNIRDIDVDSLLQSRDMDITHMIPRSQITTDPRYLTLRKRGSPKHGNGGPNSRPPFEQDSSKKTIKPMPSWIRKGTPENKRTSSFANACIAGGGAAMAGGHVMPGAALTAFGCGIHGYKMGMRKQYELAKNLGYKEEGSDN